MTDSMMFPGAIPNRPARVIQPGTRGMRGSVIVLGKAIDHESELERDFLWQMTLDRSLVAIRQQPIRIKREGRRGATSYVPDYVTVHRAPGTASGPAFLVQVKYRGDLREDWAKLKPGLRAGCRFARANGMRHVILTDLEIRRPSLDNAKLLAPYRRIAADPEIETHLVHRLAAIGPSTPRELVLAAYDAEANRRIAHDHVLKLIAEWRIEADLEDPLTHDTPISVDMDGQWRTGPNPYSWKPVALRLARAVASGRLTAPGALDGAR